MTVVYKPGSAIETTILITDASGSEPRIGALGDRGCVSCGFVIDPTKPYEQQKGRTLVLDGRGRYWCFDCVADALANVRRRVDERTKYDYPWRFEDTGGPNGQHRRARMVGTSTIRCTFVCLSEWCRAELTMAVEHGSVLADGTSTVRCPGCYQPMKLQERST